MNVRTIILASVLCCSASALCLGKDAYLGTWTLVSVSQDITGAHPVLGPDGNVQLALDVSATPPLEASILYVALGDDKVKVIVDGLMVNNQMHPAHYEWTGKFDGTDYPVVGDPSADTRSYRMIDQHRIELIIKKGGEIIPNGRVTLVFKGKKCFAGSGIYRRN